MGELEYEGVIFNEVLSLITAGGNSVRGVGSGVWVGEV